MIGVHVFNATEQHLDVALDLCLVYSVLVIGQHVQKTGRKVFHDQDDAHSVWDRVQQFHNLIKEQPYNIIDDKKKLGEGDLTLSFVEIVVLEPSW